MHVTNIWCYPIKSCAGIRLESAVLDERGVRDDRRWMLVDALGNLITARELPILLRVTPSVTETALRVSAPDMPSLELDRWETGAKRRVRVWGDYMEALTLPQATSWFRRYTDREIELVYIPDSSPRPMNPAFGDRHLTFVDGNPLHIISESSVVELNGRLERPVAIERFRANLAFGGAEPYAEDAWEKITIGDIAFSVYEACQRCVILNLDPATTAASKEPLATLARYRRSGTHVVFGRNVSHLELGVIRVGDALDTESSSSALR